jgi:hypothetical protein
MRVNLKLKSAAVVAVVVALIAALGFGTTFAGASDSPEEFAFIGVPNTAFESFGDEAAFPQEGDEFSFVDDLFAVGDDNLPTGPQLGRSYIDCKAMATTEPVGEDDFGVVELLCQFGVKVYDKGDLFGSVAFDFNDLEDPGFVIGGIHSGTLKYFGASGELKVTDIEDANPDDDITNSLYEFRLV